VSSLCYQAFIFSKYIFLFLEHAIGASDATASFELQVDPEGLEGNPEVEVQQVGLEEPEEEVECQITSQLRS